MESQYEKDLLQPLMINGAKSSKGYYNLVVSIRDVKFWQMGMKPTRSWKITDVKNYFNLKGRAEKVLEQLEDMLKEFKQK